MKRFKFNNVKVLFFLTILRDVVVEQCTMKNKRQLCLCVFLFLRVFIQEQNLLSCVFWLQTASSLADNFTSLWKKSGFKASVSKVPSLAETYIIRRTQFSNLAVMARPYSGFSDEETTQVFGGNKILNKSCIWPRSHIKRRHFKLFICEDWSRNYSFSCNLIPTVAVWSLSNP